MLESECVQYVVVCRVHVNMFNFVIHPVNMEEILGMSSLDLFSVS